MRCSFHDILLAFFFNFIICQLFNWRLSFIDYFFLLLIGLFTYFENNLDYFESFYLLFFVKFNILKIT